VNPSIKYPIQWNPSWKGEKNYNSLFPTIPELNRSQTEPEHNENPIFSGKFLQSRESKHKVPYSTKSLLKRGKKCIILYFQQSQSETALKLNLNITKTLSSAENFYSPVNPSIKYPIQRNPSWKGGKKIYNSLFPTIPEWNRSQTEPEHNENPIFSGKLLQSRESKHKVPYSTKSLLKRGKKFIILYFLQSQSETALKLNLNITKTLSSAENLYSPVNPSIKYPIQGNPSWKEKKIQSLEVPL